MSAEKVVVDTRGDVFVLPDFLSADECDAFIAASEGRGYEEARIATARGQVIAKDVRNNDRLIFDDVALADAWWPRAQAHLPPAFGRWQALGLNERFRFYRYRPGQKFAAHRDGSFERNADECSWMTLMVYLNDGYGGGRTRFDLPGFPEPVLVEPRRGMALVFMHDKVHEGEEVTSGAKYVLRTDVMYRRG
jgi:prolyl 4-hydroxylase